MSDLKTLVQDIESGQGKLADIEAILETVWETVWETSQDAFDIISKIQEQDASAISDFETLEIELDKLLPR